MDHDIFNTVLLFQTFRFLLEIFLAPYGHCPLFIYVLIIISICAERWICFKFATLILAIYFVNVFFFFR